MKVRWTEDSLRLRITPSELAALEHQERVEATLTLPGGLVWHVILQPYDGQTRLTSERNAAWFYLSAADRAQLAQPDREGVYFQTEDARPLRFFVEKDFPCAHPVWQRLSKPPTETFEPPADFEARKNVPA